MTRTKPALNLLVYTKELPPEEGITWIEVRSGDVVDRHAFNPSKPTDFSHHRSAQEFAREHGEDIEDEPIQVLNGGRIYRLARKES